MKNRVNLIGILLYIVLMLVSATGCGQQELPPKPTEVVTDENEEKSNLLKTTWIHSERKPEETNAWSVEKYIEDFLPKVTDGELEISLYALDNNLLWNLSEVWTKGEDGEKRREYRMAKYNIDLEQGEGFSYSLKLDEVDTGFEYLIQGIEDLTYHIVGMDCVDEKISLLVGGTDEERNIPLFYMIHAGEDGQVLNVIDISDVLADNGFDCPVKTMPGLFRVDKKGNLFLMDPEMLNVYVLNTEGEFSEIITPSRRTPLCFKGKLPEGEPVYDYSNGDGTRTIVTYDGSGQRYLYNGGINWSDGTYFSSYGKAFFVENNRLQCWNVVDGTTEILCDRIEAAIYDYVWMNDRGGLFLISVGKEPHMVKLTNKPPKEVVELELCITTGSQYVEECAIAYNTRHPYVKINIKNVSRFDDMEMNKLLTDIAEGKGPDILVLDREHLVSFYDAGALADLSGVLTDDIKEHIFPGVLDYGTVENKLVGITCEATLSTLFVSKEVWNETRWDRQDVLELVKSREKAGAPVERVVASSVTPYQMLGDLALRDISNSGFVNPDEKTCSFDSEEFLLLLEHCKKYGQEAGDYKDNEELFAELNGGKSLAYAFAGGFAQFSRIKAMLGEDYYCVGYPSEGELGSFLQFYGGCTAVSSQSSKSKEANDFLQYLLEYSTQKKYGLEWVRGDVLADSVKDAVEIYGYKEPIPVFYKTASSMIPLDGKEDGTSYVKEYIELAESCVPDLDEYEKIRLIVIEEVQPFFNGQKTAKQVAAIIQSRVTVLLEE